MTNERTNARHTSKTKVLIEILLPQHNKEVSMTNERTNARPHERASRRTPANERTNDLNFRELFSMKHLDFQELSSRNLCTSYFVLKCTLYLKARVVILII